MLSVRNMLGESPQTDESKGYSKPSALDISFLLCPPESERHLRTEISSYNINPSSKEECYIEMPWEKQQQHLSNNYTPHLKNNCSIKVSPPVSTSSSISSTSSVHQDGILYRQRSPRQRHMESKQIERELLHDSRRNSSSSCSSSYSSSRNASGDEDEYGSGVKAKRRRASSKQLGVLNKVFERTFFPSTQLRAELGRQLGMNPRTVQIWFQNRRQAIRTKERIKDKPDHTSE
jgi:hypothetical protein